MAPRRAIGERLKRAGTLAVRKEVALAWYANWHRDHMDTMSKIENALMFNDVADAGRLLGQLKALHEKAFGALPRVIESLADDDIA